MKKHFLKFLVIIVALVSLPAVVRADGDIMTTFSGAQFIAGVNWGTVTATNHSILISNAHLIPMNPSGGAITFVAEWGIGSPGQNNGDYTVLNHTQPTTLSYEGNFDYSFTLPINNLEPNTNYYFTIREINPYETPGPGEVDLGYNLFTYGFATTEVFGNSSVHYQFPNGSLNNNLMVYGQLVNSVGGTLLTTPINIILQDANHTELTSAEAITGQLFTQNGAGYFSHTFIDLAASGITNAALPGGQYYIAIKRLSDNAEIMTPLPFSVPSPSNPGGGNNNPTYTVPTTTYSGLVACDGPDCDFNAFLNTVNRVVNFLIFIIAFPLVAVVVAWAGIKLLMSGGNSGAKEQAKSMIWKVIIGLVVALLSWVIIKLILVTLGYQGPLLAIFGIN